MKIPQLAIPLILLTGLILTGCSQEAKTLYSNSKGEATVEELELKSEKEPYQQQGFKLEQAELRKAGTGASLAKDGSEISLKIGGEVYPAVEYKLTSSLETDVMLLKISFSLEKAVSGEVKLTLKDSKELVYSYQHAYELTAHTGSLEAYILMPKKYQLPLYYEVTLDDKLLAEGVYTGAVDELGEEPEETEEEEDAAPAAAENDTEV